MTDLILLKPVDEIGAGLEPGELAIDQVARTISLDLGAGVETIPLDVSVLPPVTEDIDPEAVAVMGADGPTWKVLSAGGGGSPFDAATWRVPGVLLTGTSTLLISTRFEVVFEITEAVSTSRIRIAPVADTIDYRFGVTPEDDPLNELIDISESAYPGPIERSVGVQLDPGLYRFFVEPVAPLTFKTYIGLRPWNSAPAAYPILLSFV